MTSAPHHVERAEVERWLAGRPALSDALRSIGARSLDPGYAEEVLRIPLHLRFAIERLAAEQGGAPVPVEALSSIPFASLCRGLFVPLAGLHPERTAHLFGLRTEPPPDARGRERLLADLFAKPIGLAPALRLSAALGDPFRGRPATLRRDSLMRVLGSLTMIGRRRLLYRLAQVGDVAALYAETRAEVTPSRPLTAAEVLEALRFLPEARYNEKLFVLGSLVERMSKVEAYFLARLVLRKAGFGVDTQTALVARVLAERHQADEEQVAHAMALTDAFHVLEVLERDGPPGLKRIRLQPLVPVRPALAGGSASEVARFPVWVERKYDGIRLMLHKSTDARGSVLAGAYTRTRGDWLEMIPGMAETIARIPARAAIVDGELYGVIPGIDRARPATVYEVYAALTGERRAPITLRFAAFDLVYLNGEDVTERPLGERRRRLELLLAPLAHWPLPIPLALAEGQLAESKPDLNRLYQHFRAQGYEGIIAKDLASPYRLGARDPSWLKQKPAITLDLVLLGAVLAVTSKERAAMFGSYVIGALSSEGTYEEVGDIAGVDRERDADIQREILREGLLTGRRIERKGVSGVRPGLELRPHIVVTVRFEGVVRDAISGSLSLRDPKLVVIRADKAPAEADTLKSIEAVHLRERMG